MDEESIDKEVSEELGEAPSEETEGDEEEAPEEEEEETFDLPVSEATETTPESTE